MINAAFIKPLLVVAGVIVLLGVGFVSGYNWCNSGQQGAVYDSIDEGKKKVAKVKEIIKYRDKKVVVYVDKIKTVVDKTGCADIPADHAIDSQLHEIYRLTRGSAAN